MPNTYVSFGIGASNACPSASGNEGVLFFDTTNGTISRSDGSNWVVFGDNEVEVKTTTDGANAPSATPRQGVLYVNTADKTVKVYTGSNNWVTIASGIASKNIVTEIGATGSDDNIPTEQAVREALADYPKLTGGKLSSTVIPQYAISEYKGSDTTKAGMASTAAANGAEPGDFASVSGSGSDAGVYILSEAPASTAANWVKITLPTQTTVTVDDSITENSNNPVTSAAIYTALAGKAEPLTWTTYTNSNS